MGKPTLTVAIAPRSIVIAIALFLLLLALKTFPLIVGLVLVSLVVASALEPPVRFLVAHRWPRPAAIGVIFLSLFAVGALLVLLVLPVVLEQARALVANLPGTVVAVQDWLSRLTRFYAARAGQSPEISRVVVEVSAWLSQRLGGWLQAGLSFTLQVASALAGLMMVLLSAFFLLLQGPELGRGFVSLFPARHRELIAAQFRPVIDRLGAYVRGQLMSMSALATMLAIGLSLIGLPYAWLIALLSGVLEIVPYLGFFTGVTLATLVGLTVSWKVMLLAWVVYAISNFIQANVLGPFIMARTVEISPLLVIYAVLIGSQLLGLVGAIVAVPVTAMLLVLIQNLYVPVMDRLTDDP
ncbi:AI-2E family transporter [bacterium]|nr:AI-2E family transporter [bacterium]